MTELFSHADIRSIIFNIRIAKKEKQMFWIDWNFIVSSQNSVRRYESMEIH